MTPFSVRRRSCVLVALTLFTVACRTEAPYRVTAEPIDVGQGIRICIAIRDNEPRGLWWWGAGATGCASRSTGPDLFRPEDAQVSSAGSQTTASFRLGTHSASEPTIDVRLVFEGGYIRSTNTGQRVPLIERADLVIPEAVPGSERR